MSFFIFDKNKILLKSGPHKYVQRLPTGKIKDPWRYIYAKDLLKPWTALKEFFSITKERITKEFEKHNIFSTFGVTKEDYGVHVLNYASNKSKWDNFFLNKFNRKKFEKPIKEAPSSPKKKSSGTKTKKTEPKEEEKDFWKHPNKSLMEKVWTLYNPNAKNIIAQSKKNIVDKVINNPSTPVQEEKEDKKTSERVKAFNALKETFKKSGLIPNDELETLTVDSLEDLQAVAKNIKDTPDLYESEGEDDKKVYLHYFTPNKDYYVCELSEDGEAYGFVDNSGDPSLSEWGYFDCKELVEATYELKGNDTLLGAELDLHFTPKSLKDTIKASGHSDLFKTVGIEDEPTEPAKDETKGFEIYEPPENNEPVEPQGEDPQPFTIIESDEEPTEENEVKEDDFELVETEQEKHENRSNAMLGNDNAKKDGITKEDLSKKYNISEGVLDTLIIGYIMGISEKHIEDSVKELTDNPQALLEEIKNSNLIQERATDMYNEDVKKQSTWYGCSKYEWERLSKIAYNLSKKYEIPNFEHYTSTILDKTMKGDDNVLLLEISRFALDHKTPVGFVMEEMRKTGKNGAIGGLYENNEVKEESTGNEDTKSLKEAHEALKNANIKLESKTFIEKDDKGGYRYFKVYNPKNNQEFWDYYKENKHFLSSNNIVVRKLLDGKYHIIDYNVEGTPTEEEAKAYTDDLTNQFVEAYKKYAKYHKFNGYENVSNNTDITKNINDNGFFENLLKIINIAWDMTGLYDNDEDITKGTDEEKKQAIESNLLERENVVLKTNDTNPNTVHIWKGEHFMGDMYAVYDKNGNYEDTRIVSSAIEWRDWEKSKEELTKYYDIYRQERAIAKEKEEEAKKNLTLEEKQNLDTIKYKMDLNSYTYYSYLIHEIGQYIGVDFGSDTQTWGSFVISLKMKQKSDIDKNRFYMMKINDLVNFAKINNLEFGDMVKDLYKGGELLVKEKPLYNAIIDQRGKKLLKYGYLEFEDGKNGEKKSIKNGKRYVYEKTDDGYHATVYASSFSYIPLISKTFETEQEAIDFLNNYHLDIEPIVKETLDEQRERVAQFEAKKELETEQEKHDNRSNAMLGNQNAKKDGVIDDGGNDNDNTRTIGSGLSNTIGEVHTGTDTGNSSENDGNTGTGSDRNEPIQQPDKFGNGPEVSNTTSDGAGTGTGTDSGAGNLKLKASDKNIENGMLTAGDTRKIREKCLEILKKPDSEITAEEKEILRHYEGAGDDRKNKKRTSAQILNEFYTPRDVIAKMWDLVDKYIPSQNKKVLEPSAGTGRFMEGRPSTEKFTLCELDETSARIARLIHPEATVKQGRFENNFMKNGVPQDKYDGEKYDVVIGNPPYGDYEGVAKGKGEKSYHKTNPGYFIERGLDTLKEGGILTFIVPSGFLNTLSSKGKEAIAKKGKLLEAWRMPTGTFKSTGVGTDIIVIQKGKGDIKDFIKGNYFKDNPSHVLGSIGENWRGEQLIQMEGTREETLARIDPNAVAIDNEVKENLKKLSAIEEPKEKKVTKLVEKKFIVIGDIKIGATVYNKDGKKGNITGVNRKKQTFDYFVKDDDGSSLVSRKNDFKDFTVVQDEETAEEISHNRSEGMKGNDNAKGKHNVKVVRKSAQKGEIYTPSTGKNMTADEFNKKYNKNTFNKDLKFWAHKDWNGNIDTSNLNAEELEELKNSDNFVKINGKYTPTMLYASGNIYDKLKQLENEKEGISVEEYERRKALLNEVLPPKREIDQFTISPLANLAKQFKNSAGENLIDQFLKYCGFNSEGDIDPSSNSPLSINDLDEGCVFKDVFEYIKQKPVRSASSRDSSQKVLHQMQAEERRTARRNTTERLFNQWLREKIPTSEQNQIVDEWNKRFNAYVNPDYSNIPLFVEGMNENMGDHEFTLTNQQLKGISELCNKGNGLLAYDVGVGKTACGIVATVNQLQTGKAKKPLICVPKAVYKNWISSIHQHFPELEINELGNLSKADTDQFRDENGKIVLPENRLNVMTYEGLGNITFKEETLNGDLLDDMTESQSIYDYDENGNKVADTRTDAQKAQEREKMLTKLGKTAKAGKDAIYFEDLGIDHITVDEVHNFKNIFAVPRSYGHSNRRPDDAKSKKEQLANEFSGLNGATSDRGLKMFAISQLIQKNNDGRGFFGLSATPFNNSPVEIYNILSLCARNRLKDLNIYNLQDFLKEFAELKPDWKVKADGSVENELVMKNFKNLGALQNLITEFIDKVDGEEAGVKRPYKRIHKPMLDLSPIQKFIIQAETARISGYMDELKQAEGEDIDDENTANTLIAMNNMRMATLSPSLVDTKFYEDYRLFAKASGVEFTPPNQNKLVEESPKLKFVCDMTSKQYKDRPKEGQVIYMPRGVKRFNEVKNYLVKQGMPADSIAFIDSKIKTEKKEEIMKDFNDPDGKIKVVIGSETIKEGVNLNGNSSTIYNTMLGWNPTETIQVEGRIWRQGNKQGVTHVVYPLMNDSIDSLMYQKYDEKSSRLNALWSYKGDTLNVEDINPEELKFELIKDPVRRADLQIKKQSEELERQIKLSNARYDDLYYTRKVYHDSQKKLDELTPRYDNLKNLYDKSKERLAEEIKEVKKLQTKQKKNPDDATLNMELHEKAGTVMDVQNKVQYYARQFKSIEKEVKENQANIENFDRYLQKNGLKDEDAVNTRLNDLIAQTNKLKTEKSVLEDKRDDYIEIASTAIKMEQEQQHHATVKENVDYYVNEIANDLRSFDSVKSGLEALNNMKPSEIQNVINNIEATGSVKVGDDILTKRELKDIENAKNRAQRKFKKSLVIQDGKFLMIEKAIKPKAKVLIKNGKFYIN